MHGLLNAVWMTCVLQKQSHWPDMVVDVRFPNASG